MYPIFTWASKCEISIFTVGAYSCTGCSHKASCDNLVHWTVDMFSMSCFLGLVQADGALSEFSQFRGVLFYNAFERQGTWYCLRLALAFFLLLFFFCIASAKPQPWHFSDKTFASCLNFILEAFKNRWSHLIFADHLFCEVISQFIFI